MADLDLAAIRKMAKEASKGLPMIRHTARDQFRQEMSPAVVLALLDRVEKAEADLRELSELAVNTDTSKSNEITRLRSLLARAWKAIMPFTEENDENWDITFARAIAREIAEAIGHE